MTEWRRQLSRLLFLALFFFAGIVLGQVFSSRVPDATGDELARYLTDFLKLGEGDPAPRTVLSAAALYFRYPLAAFLLSFASIGVLLLPLVTGAFGFFLSFSVCCFTAAFGPGAGGVRPPVRGDAALLFPAGGPGAGTLCGPGLFVPGGRAVLRSGGLWPEVVEPAGGDLRGAGGRDVCRPDAGPLGPAPAFGTDTGLMGNTALEGQNW